ncbi:[SSU ribosomal protein S18P]-alanine acetyltransferase [Methanolobus vulcani]|jgi:ribosomal-protein-alanine N-acetyltransferase|uniref:[SSU ribosomal protein S18P]-alanine acetyltransferase n=1 Tax=Methanolobus vulcani TaxID=38026 RepID=A0A7Z7B0L1_9EURY|nr:N-acetyltransferase [Methanolobus vulcani]MDK2827003.1 [ribosomal protein S18]-alanine N-acetyltransferase [Methanolobus sp.]MDK2947917.1 [ribosomal protein S18]-alanine N-acetyltransferase [Methanolobus sp.]SDG19392.1 [SSU ribosomal protein S18P]-alanine acetyltransferase [Methanolobus vulcani]
MIVIRNFEPSDFEEVLEIESQAFSEHNPFLYMNFYEMNSEGFLVAEYNNYVVGFVVGYELSETEGRIFSLAVREGFRSMGIGARLMDGILSVFICKLLTFASLEVRVTNTRAQDFYKRRDFIACWIQHGYYSDGEDGIIMKKRLTPSITLSL